MKNEIIIYQSKSGAIEFKGDFKKETLWASQEQIASLFDIERSVATKHIRNILKDKELDEKSVCAKFAHTSDDGKKYQVQYYNLDVLLAVGYRTNSAKATQFRQWATVTLRKHILDGYTINKKQLARNYENFLLAVEDIKKIPPVGGQIKNEDVLELIKAFASTWFSLASYDKETLPTAGATKKQVKITKENVSKALLSFKEELIADNEASAFFGIEKEKGVLGGIIGNIFQSFGGNDLYPTIEEKAAHLFYFVVKNHPFIDGNKRNGAFAFVWFLRKAGILDMGRLTPEALTALTLLVAESNPKDKEKMVRLILTILKKSGNRRNEKMHPRNKKGQKTA